MPRPEIEEFAKTLMASVRDAAIRENDLVFLAKDATATRWRDAAACRSHEEFAKAIIPEIVDSVLYYLLYAIDDGQLKLSYTASSGKIVDLAKDGESELAGWYIGCDAWRAKYAKERFVNDINDPSPQ